MTKSKQELENEILELRLKIMDKVLTEKTNPKSSKIKIWAPVILTFVSIAAGLFGILFPSIKYINQQNDQYEFTFNKEMVAFANELNSEDYMKREQAIMMLTYYEEDAVPILLHKLERINYRQKNNICSALKTIKNLSRKDKLLIEKMLFKNAVDFYDRAYLHPDGEVVNRIHGMMNYVFALGELGEKEKEKYKLFLDKISNTIDQCEIDNITKEQLVKVVTDSKEKLK